MPWTFDSHDLALVPRILGLRHPIRFHVKKMWWDGLYSGADPHLIEISLETHPYWLSHTIWHELGHAHQCERYFDGDFDALTAQTTIDYGTIFDRCPYDSNGIGEEYDEWFKEYSAIPHEAEADQIANRYSKRFPLLRRI